MKSIGKIAYWMALCALVFSCSGKQVTVFDALPGDAEIFVETSDPEGFFRDLSGKTYLEPFVENDPEIASLKELVVQLDSLLRMNDKVRKPVLSSRMLLASVPCRQGTRGVMLAKMEEKLSEADFKSFLKWNGMQYEPVKISKKEGFLLPNQDSLLVFLEGPLMVVSKDTEVVDRVVGQLSRTVKIDSDEDFKRLRNTLGHHVKAHLFVRDFRGWAALDVIAEEVDVVMNGYMIAADSSSSLRPLKYQLPVKNSIVNILPFDTKLMLHYGMSDYASYWQSFRDAEQVAAFNKRYGVNVERQLLNHVSEVSYDIICDKRHEVFVARMNDPSAVIKFMDGLSSKTGVVETKTVQGYVLYYLGDRDIVPSVFGTQYKSMKRTWYAIMDQYLVMASQSEPIEEMITCYRSGRTLDLNENFRSFQQKMLESSNITLFATGAGNQPKVSAMVKGLVGDFLDDHPKLLDAYRDFSIQLASSKDMVYINVCLSHHAQTNNEQSVRWKVNLDAPLQGKPYIIRDFKTSNQLVVAFDTQNTLYLIDSEGAILWKRQLGEAPMGDVFGVDCYNNGKIQFLFNTAHTLQLIDRNGDSVSGYPLPLPFEASNGLAVFDYNGNHDYRVLLCGTDKLVYNYTLQGVEVEGWNHHRSEDLVTRPIQHIRAADKDYLIVSDVSGGVRILDRQGRIRIPLPSDLQKSQNADIYANVTNRGKGLFLTSDKEGKLLYIGADGSMNRTDFGEYSKKHFFLYEDFNGDQDPDFVYLDNRELQVYDRFKNVLFANKFDVDIVTKPVFFPITRNKRLLGIVCEKAREIYLIDRKGKMIVNSGLVGETSFAVGSLHNDQEINLITGVGNALYNYAIY